MSNQFESENRARAEGMLMGYLEVVCMPMNLREYESSRRELSGHLFELAVAYEEIGLSPEEAMRAAIGKLGPPKPLGQAIATPAEGNLQIPQSWLAVVCGGFASMVAMSLADLIVVKLHIYTQTQGAVTGLLGMVMGLLAATFVVRSRWSLPFKAILNGLLYGPGLFIVIASLNGRPIQFISIVSCVLFGLAGLTTSIATHVARVALQRPKNVPAAV